MLTKRSSIILTVIALTVVCLAVMTSKLNVQLKEITEKDKCPACFGLSACKEIDEKRITFADEDIYSIFNKIINVKNFYYGNRNGQMVVLKKLASRSELEELDELICANPLLGELCFRKSTLEGDRQDFYKLTVSELEDSDMTDPDVKLRLCPTAAKASKLFSKVQMEKFIQKEDNYKFLWTSIKINPEPIMLQILSAKEGWPTPKYYGACGRLIVEEYIGPPLSNFIHESWIRRAKIVYSLLDAAYKFTFKDPNFAFYLTDISADNVVVNDKDEAVFIDLENIIVVDKSPSNEVLKNIKMWNGTYTNTIDHGDCQDCFVFSPIDLCNHKISDHNFYAICQLIFTHEYNSNTYGFLHDPPDDILKQDTALSLFYDECLKPVKFLSRIEAGTFYQDKLFRMINVIN